LIVKFTAFIRPNLFGFANFVFFSPDFTTSSAVFIFNGAIQPNFEKYQSRLTNILRRHYILRKLTYLLDRQFISYLYRGRRL